MSRSLILFNALFALQTVLDLTYLWGGASLPDGMSHAEYAHRGAYPLIAPRCSPPALCWSRCARAGRRKHSRLIRPLVLAWIAQNMLLVISSIFRLDLYVAAYSLTYLRLAAFIWMVLVAIGLVLILVQIELKKSNSWLLSANAIALALALYACCFINAPWLVASYNVEHAAKSAARAQARSAISGVAWPASRAAARGLICRKLPALGPTLQPCSPAHASWTYRRFRASGKLAGLGFSNMAPAAIFALTIPPHRLNSPE